MRDRSRKKRPRYLNLLAKSIVDEATGEESPKDNTPESKDPSLNNWDNEGGAILPADSGKDPAVSLRKAVDKVRLLFEADGQSGSTRESAFKHLGYNTTSSGSALGLMSAIKKFGLIKEDSNRILLTNDALLILLKGGNEELKREAIRRCALKPELFKNLWNQYSLNGLPSDDTLRSELVIGHRFNAKAVDIVIRSFRDTLDYAGIKAGQFLSSEDTQDEREGQENGADEENNDNTPREQFPSTPQFPNAFSKTDSAGKMRDYLIPRVGDKIALLRLEKPVTKADLDQVRSWLTLMEKTLVEQPIPEEDD